MTQVTQTTEQVARLPLISTTTADPILAPLFERIRERSGAVLHMHRVVAHSPEIFSAYVDLAYALRFASKIPRRERELIILRVTQRAGGNYEFVHHQEYALKYGVTQTQIDALDRWRGSDLFDKRDRAILDYTDSLTDPSGTSTATFEALASFYSAKEIIELTLTAGFYNLSSQVSRAMDVKLEAAWKDEKKPK